MYYDEKERERKDKVNGGGMGEEKKLKEGQGEKSIFIEIYNSICSFLASDFFIFILAISL